MKQQTSQKKSDQMLRVILIDDEPLAIQKLRHFIKKEAGIEIVDESMNGHDAIASIRKHAPDLIFLDIQMPEMDGFALLRELSEEELPAVIFVTAYDEFALKAFEVHAVDYLLKPFDRDRFSQALTHARERLKPAAPQGMQHELRSLLDVAVQVPHTTDRLMIKSDGKVVFVKKGDIDWLEAAGNYIKLHCGAEVHMMRETMSGILAQLDASKFLRIHRASIVNIERIKEMHPWFNGEYKVILTTNTQLVMSRGCHEQFTRTFGKPL